MGRLRGSRPRVGVVETSDVRICALRCAQSLLPGAADSHTALGRIATLRSSGFGDCGVPPAQTVGSASAVDGAASRITTEGWRCGDVRRAYLCTLLRSALLLPGVADSHTALDRIAKLRSSDFGDFCVPPARAVGSGGRGGFAHHDRGLALWRRPTGVSVHSAALSTFAARRGGLSYGLSYVYAKFVISLYL